MVEWIRWLTAVCTKRFYLYITGQRWKHSESCKITLQKYCWGEIIIPLKQKLFLLEFTSPFCIFFIISIRSLCWSCLLCRCFKMALLLLYGILSGASTHFEPQNLDCLCKARTVKGGNLFPHPKVWHHMSLFKIIIKKNSLLISLQITVQTHLALNVHSQCPQGVISFCLQNGKEVFMHFCN